MASSNIDVVQRIYALAAEDWDLRKAGGDPRADALTELLSPNIVVQENAEFPDTDSYHGYEGLLRWWTGFLEVYDDVGMEPREFIPAGDSVVVSVHHTLRSKAGVVLEQDMHHVWTLRDGRVVHVTGYRDRAKALEAARGSGDG